MTLAAITFDAQNLGIIGAIIGAVTAFYTARVSFYTARVSARKQLDDRTDTLIESIERERDYWKTEAELWRRRYNDLISAQGSGA